MDEIQIMCECDVCGGTFQFGPHIYNGRLVKAWGDAMICRSCDLGNHDGIVPNAHPRFVEFLRAKGIPLDLNDRGWIRIPGSGN